MRAVPFILVLVILVFGAATAFQTMNSPTDAAPEPTVQRPTVTPRPRPTSPRPSETPAPVAAPAAPVAGAPAGPPTVEPVVPTPDATPTPSSQSGQVMKVGNTDREGVFIRRTPNMDDKIRPWMDGTPMTVLGPPESAGGTTWVKVRAPDGVEGYIPAQYLVP